MTKYSFILAAALFLSCSIYVSAQTEDIQIGSGLNQQRYSPGAFYDYSDPASVNIKVAIWGFVRYPGKYIVPSTCTANDLLSYAGGPTDDAKLEEMRLSRMNHDSSQTIINLNYKDILHEPESNHAPMTVLLKPGDILLVSGAPRLYFQNYLSIGLSIVSTLVSITTLIYLIVRK